MSISLLVFFFNDTATTEIYTLSLHDALPILAVSCAWRRAHQPYEPSSGRKPQAGLPGSDAPRAATSSVRLPSHHVSSSSQSCRSEEHTSELQSRQYLVCRLLLEKKKNNDNTT